MAMTMISCGGDDGGSAAAPPAPIPPGGGIVPGGEIPPQGVPIASALGRVYDLQLTEELQMYIDLFSTVQGAQFTSLPLGTSVTAAGAIILSRPLLCGIEPLSIPAGQPLGLRTVNPGVFDGVAFAGGMVLNIVGTPVEIHFGTTPVMNNARVQELSFDGRRFDMALYGNVLFRAGNISCTRFLEDGLTGDI